MEYTTKSGKKLIIREDAVKSLGRNYKANTDSYKQNNKRKNWVNGLDEYDIGSFIYNSMPDSIEKITSDLIIDERFLNRYYKNLAVEPDEAGNQIIPHFVYEIVYEDKFIGDYLE